MAGLRTRLEALPEDERHFELLVVTHIDADHIDRRRAMADEVRRLDPASEPEIHRVAARYHLDRLRAAGAESADGRRDMQANDDDLFE